MEVFDHEREMDPAERDRLRTTKCSARAAYATGQRWTDLTYALKRAWSGLHLWIAVAALLNTTACAQWDSSGPVEDSVAHAVTENSLLDTGDNLGNLLDHPSLTGFAEHTLPWYGRTYDRDLPLNRIGSLLPYHSAVDPAAVVGSLNLLIENANRGVKVFHEIYPEAARRADPQQDGSERSRPGRGQSHPPRFDRDAEVARRDPTRMRPGWLFRTTLRRLNEAPW